MLVLMPATFGHPIYDLLFAFCSTPAQITLESLNRLLTKLSVYFPVNVNNAKSYLQIALFKRISSSKKHHPADLPAYPELWKILKDYGAPMVGIRMRWFFST